MERPAPAYVSEQEFLSLPETLDKMELIDGEVVVAPSPGFLHQEVVGRLGVALRAWASKQPSKVTVAQAPTDVRFAPGKILQPDLFLVFDRIPLDSKGPLTRVP